jgi:phosphoribosylformylglycinamidine cyclo-ligase
VENSGIGSNGLTSARHDLLHHDYLHRYPESVDASVDSAMQYSGSLHLTQGLNQVLATSLGLEPQRDRDSLDFGRWLLSPTRTYAPLICSMLRDFGSTHLHGLIHCSGGGQTKVLHFVKDLCLIKDTCFEVPPLFALIQKISGTSWEEMYRVFNMGHRLEAYISEDLVDSTLAWSKEFGIEAKVIGRVEAVSSANEAAKGSPGLVLEGPKGLLRYNP